jgi:uncharacterized membrane protein (DUF4010 family)
VSLSSRVRQAPELRSLAAVMIIAASSTMFGRILVVIGIVDAPLLPALLWPMGAMMGIGYAAAFALYRSTGRALPETEPVAHRNPFELRSALQFGVLYAVVIVVAKAAQVFLGHPGLYASSVLAGATDVDAISLSLARFHRQGLDAAAAATAITLAAVTNTLVKAALAFWLGGASLAARVVPLLGAALAAGAFALFLI